MLTFAMRKRQSKRNRSVHQTSTCFTMCGGSRLVCLLNIAIHYTEWLVSFRGRWVGFRLARGSGITLPFTRRSNIKHTWTVWRVSQTAMMTAAERMFFCAGSNHGWEVRVRRARVFLVPSPACLTNRPKRGVEYTFFSQRSGRDCLLRWSFHPQSPTLVYIQTEFFHSWHIAPIPDHYRSIPGTSHPYLTTTDCTFFFVQQCSTKVHQFIPNGVDSPCSLRDCDLRSSLSTM